MHRGQKHEKIFRTLEVIAEDTVSVAAAKISAALVIKNEIIAIGTNKFKTHPFQARFGKNDMSIYLHAETDAIKNALKRLNTIDLSACSLYVCRVKNDGGHLVRGLSKPCAGCSRAIATFNIKNVYYTNNETGYSCL